MDQHTGGKCWSIYLYTPGVMLYQNMNIAGFGTGFGLIQELP